MRVDVDGGRSLRKATQEREWSSIATEGGYNHHDSPSRIVREPGGLEIPATILRKISPVPVTTSGKHVPAAQSYTGPAEPPQQSHRARAMCNAVWSCRSEAEYRISNGTPGSAGWRIPCAAIGAILTGNQVMTGGIAVGLEPF
ncbi:hypothetical protein GGE45_001582 [Rhizobium aethiopicum]|uniref:Uncharacterized protein n=1 Tax=Rhizobium aethiopicum TaxID=1138170 RepID=A0A7W6MHW7_9HYPH|nr:hypothetical protein [Rhizobium aethiopicum]MBB4192996.1 hypothetical protein [Rhizobium aethiopicum]MBB4579258.1 hypothetical protein [Rhizobium aethiopicum]